MLFDPTSIAARRSESRTAVPPLGVERVEIEMGPARVLMRALARGCGPEHYRRNVKKVLAPFCTVTEVTAPRRHRFVCALTEVSSENPFQRCRLRESAASLLQSLVGHRAT